MARKRKTPPDQPGLLPATSAGRHLPVPQGYDAFLRDLEERIRNSQIGAPL
jgi:hypothetical protein